MINKIKLKAYELSHLFGDDEHDIELDLGSISNGFWGKHISMVSAIVGKNGVGKSSLLRYIKDKSDVKRTNESHSNIIYFSPHLDYRDNYNLDVDLNDISLDTVLRRDLEQIFENEKESSENGWMLNPKQDLEYFNTARQMDFLTSDICKEHPVFSNIFEGLKFGFGEVSLRGLKLTNFTDNDFHNTPYKFRSVILEIIKKCNDEISLWHEVRIITKDNIVQNQHEINAYIFKRNLIFSFLSVLIDFFENDGKYLSRGNIEIKKGDYDAFELLSQFVQNAKLTNLHSSKNSKKVFNEAVLKLFNHIYFLVDEIKDEKSISNKKFSASYDNLVTIKKIQNDILSHLSRNYFTEKTKIYSFVGIQATDRKLSSGENALLNFYSVLYEFIKDLDENEIHINYILLLDEADLGYHPEWKKRFVNSIVKSLPLFFKFKNQQSKIQIIFTTHDPLTLSDIPKQNVLFLDKNFEGITFVNKENKETFGANIHDLLADSFFISDGLMGDFSKEKIDETILWLRYKLLEKEIQQSKGDTLLIKHKKQKLIQLTENNEWLSESPQKIHRQLIDLVDEPLLKYKLNEMYYQIFPKEIDKDEAKRRINEIAKSSGLNINITE